MGVMCRIAVLLTCAWSAVAAAETFSHFEKFEMPGERFAEHWAITPSGIIAGTAGESMTRFTGYVIFPDGSRRTIAVPGARATSARAVNGDGDVAGYYLDAAGGQHGFVWYAGEAEPRSIDAPGATSTQVWGLDPEGAVVGRATVGGVTRGFVLRGDPAGFSEDDFIEYPEDWVNTGAIAINARGDIAGQYQLRGDATVRGYVRSHRGELRTIAFPGATLTSANGIDSRGDVVGPYVIGGVRRGWVWRAGAESPMVVELEGAVQTHCSGVTAKGEIVGYYIDAAGVRRGFYLPSLD
jgi:hypothetical protein